MKNRYSKLSKRDIELQIKYDLLKLRNKKNTQQTLDIQKEKLNKEQPKSNKKHTKVLDPRLEFIKRLKI